MSFAKIAWSADNSRYELKIDGVLKAHSSGNNDEEHESGKRQMEKIATDKGYTVHTENKPE